MRNERFLKLSSSFLRKIFESSEPKSLQIKGRENARNNKYLVKLAVGHSLQTRFKWIESSYKHYNNGLGPTNVK